ncbi:MAG: glycoside hydrolase family 3 C-terminal domain-containing protein [Elusimicrobiales bacterium]|nr:glycoside hydrolase family 3 C-terminal domain-containing protein [Elusimicrobiales bacterium]
MKLLIASLLLFIPPLYALAETSTETLKLENSASFYTIEDKISQLLMISADTGNIDKTSAAVKNCVGGIQLQWGSYSLKDTKNITDNLQKLAIGSNCSIPLFIAVDYEGGSVYAPTTLGLLELPTNIMLGAADDEALAASLAYLAGKELKRAGINMAFGPVLDVNTNPENPIIGIRAIGDNPALVSKIGKALINGLKASEIISVGKHFPGHGATVSDSHKTLPVLKISSQELNKTHLAPFRMAIETEIPAIMTAHILYRAMDKKYPATLSKTLIDELLRKILNFKGMIITDSMDMKAITSKQGIPKAAVRALAAGADYILIGKGDFDKTKAEILKALKTGKLKEKRINDAFDRIISCKKKYNLFKKQKNTSPFDKAYVEVSKALSEKAVTLVRNNDDLLPLKKYQYRDKIAIILFSPHRFDISSLAFYKTLYRRGLNVKQYKFDIKPDARDLKKIKDYIEKADIIILGGFQWAAKQNKNQFKIIKYALKTGKPTILISQMSPYDISNFKNAATVIATYGITETTMSAAAKIIIGELSPEGKLPVKIQ